MIMFIVATAVASGKHNLLQSIDVQYASYCYREVVYSSIKHACNSSTMTPAVINVTFKKIKTYCYLSLKMKLNISNEQGSIIEK